MNDEVIGRNVACNMLERNSYKIHVGKPEERDQLKELGVDKR
jgi:hypothetical protein